MSPSEIRGHALGMRLLACERHLRTLGAVTTKVYARFEIELNGRRHYLHNFAKSRAGAWRNAIAWLKKLEDRKL